MGIFLPSEKFSINSARKSTELSRSLDEMVEKKWSPSTDYGVFVGNVSEKGFKIHQNKLTTFRRNPLSPTIIGNFNDTPEGCTVDIKMRLNIPSLIFELIWNLGLALIFVIGIIMTITDGLFYVPLTAFFMYAIPQIITRTLFRSSVRSSKERLLSILGDKK